MLRATASHAGCRVHFRGWLVYLLNTHKAYKAPAYGLLSVPAMYTKKQRYPTCHTMKHLKVAGGLKSSEVNGPAAVQPRSNTAVYYGRQQRTALTPPNSAMSTPTDFSRTVLDQMQSDRIPSVPGGPVTHQALIVFDPHLGKCVTSLTSKHDDFASQNSTAFEATRARVHVYELVMSGVGYSKKPLHLLTWSVT